MIVLRKDQLPMLVGLLQNDLPRSLMVFHLARNEVRGRYDWPGFDFVVDDFPNVSVCICRPKPDLKDYVPIINGYQVFMYSKSPDIFRRMIFEETVVDWTQDIMFASVTEPEHSVLLEYGNKTCTGKFGHYSTMDGYPPGATYLMFDLNDLDGFRFTVPDGLRLGRLQPEHALQMAKGKDYGHLENGVAFFRHMLERNFPNAAVFDQTNTPVAFIIYKSEGCVGGGYVDPAYRGKKLFQIVLLELVKQLKQQGEIFVFGDTMVYNVASQKAQENVGGKRIKNFVAHWITFTPAVFNGRLDVNGWSDVLCNGSK